MNDTSASQPTQFLSIYATPYYIAHLLIGSSLFVVSFLLQNPLLTFVGVADMIFGKLVWHAATSTFITTHGRMLRLACTIWFLIHLIIGVMVVMAITTWIKGCS